MDFQARPSNSEQAGVVHNSVFSKMSDDAISDHDNRDATAIFIKYCMSQHATGTTLLSIWHVSSTGLTERKAARACCIKLQIFNTRYSCMEVRHCMALGLSVACMCQISSLLFDSHILFCVPPCAGNLSWLPPVVANQLGRAVAEVLTSLLSSPSSDPASATKFSRAGDLLDALRLHTAADQQLLATAVAGPVAGALVGSVQQGSAPPEAASLLATLVKQFGAEVMRAAYTGAVPGAGRTTGAVLLIIFGCAPDVQDV